MSTSDNNIPCGACSYDPTLQILGSWSLELPFEAVSSNALKGNGPGASGHKYRAVRDRFEAFIKANCAHIPAAVTRRRVFFTRYYAKPKRSFDRDNLVAGFKPIRDCLTRQGLLVDDSEKYLESHYKQVRSDTNYVTIDIEDIAW